MFQIYPETQGREGLARLGERECGLGGQGQVGQLVRVPLGLFSLTNLVHAAVEVRMAASFWGPRRMNLARDNDMRMCVLYMHQKSLSLPEGFAFFSKMRTNLD